MSAPIIVRRLSKGRGALCERILRSLPGWFGIEFAITDFRREADRRPFFAATYKGETAGFLSLKVHNQRAAEVLAMGVLPDLHRRGIGKRLLLKAERYASGRGIEYLTAKTLSSSRRNRPYAQTRRFFDALGFCPVEEFKELWGPGNPCLFLVKRL